MIYKNVKLDKGLCICMDIKIYEKVLPDEAKYVRETVFVMEQGFKEEFDTTDNISVHLVAFDDGKAAGTCRYYKDDENIFYIGRLAVLKEYRCLHVGSELLKAAQESIKAKGGKIIRLHSQWQARKFYEKQGYKTFGKADYDESCLHIWMEKKL